MAYVILQESLGFVGGSFDKISFGDHPPPSVLLNGPPAMSKFFKVH